jgi:hypothetical protein
MTVAGVPVIAPADTTAPGAGETMAGETGEKTGTSATAHSCRKQNPGWPVAMKALTLPNNF